MINTWNSTHLIVDFHDFKAGSIIARLLIQKGCRDGYFV